MPPSPQPPPAPAPGTRSRLLRGGAVFAVAGLLVVGMATGSRIGSSAGATNDGTAWVADGDRVVRGSSITGAADWILPDPLGDDAHISQDGNDAVVVDGNGNAYSIDPETMEPSEPVDAPAGTRPVVRGGEAYLVEPGLIRRLDPRTFEPRGAPIKVAGQVEAQADDQGVLWVVETRSGRVLRVRDGKIDRRADVLPPGRAAQLTILNGDQPVVYDTEAGTLTWIDTRSGAADRVVEVEPGGRLQGQSDATDEDRVWIAVGGKLIGVDRDGDRVDVDPEGDGELRRPEVVDGRVLAPSTDGRVVAVATDTGEVVGQAELADARQDDFDTFVKDGRLWYSSRMAGEAGTIDPDADVTPLEVDQEALEEIVAETPDPTDPVPPPLAEPEIDEPEPETPEPETPDPGIDPDQPFVPPSVPSASTVPSGATTVVPTPGRGSSTTQAGSGGSTTTTSWPRGTTSTTSGSSSSSSSSTSSSSTSSGGRRRRPPRRANRCRPRSRTSAARTSPRRAARSWPPDSSARPGSSPGGPPTWPTPCRPRTRRPTPRWRPARRSSSTTTPASPCPRSATASSTRTRPAVRSRRPASSARPSAVSRRP